MKLYHTPEVKLQVAEILAPLKRPALWQQMDLAFAKNPYAIVRLDAPTGCGKTALAHHMAAQMKQKPLHLDFGSVAGSELGQTEKAIISLFDKAIETETYTVIMEECDGLVWTRDMVNEDSQYQLTIIAEMLRQMDRFINRGLPSLLIMNTNHPEKIDSAIASRITDTIFMGVPEGDVAKSMWRSKLPGVMKPHITDAALTELAEMRMTPRAMEQMILRACRKAAYADRMPCWEDFTVNVG